MFHMKHGENGAKSKKKKKPKNATVASERTEKKGWAGERSERSHERPPKRGREWRLFRPAFLRSECCFLCGCVEQWSGAKQKSEWRVARERLATYATMP